MNPIYQQVIKLWQSFSIQSAQELNNRLDHFRVLFAYHSGKIENPEITYHDTREIFEYGKIAGFTGNPRALFEQQNQKLCYDYLVDKLISKEPLSIPLILEVHNILTSGTYDEHRFLINDERPGQFKKHDYVTGINEVGSPAEEVEKDLSDLLSELAQYGEGINEPDANLILRVAAYFHAKFEYIHPFADGNGRVGRTLLNYFLIIHNHPPLIINDENKPVYYAALQLYDEQEELNPLAAFLEESVVKTWQKTLDRESGKDQKRKNLGEIVGS